MPVGAATAPIIHIRSGRAGPPRPPSGVMAERLAESGGSGSIGRYLAGAGVALWALVMALRPDVGFDAPWAWMALFWGLQIGVGLVLLQVVLCLVDRADPRGRLPPWAAIVVSGVIGSGVLAPLYWLIGEGLMQEILGFAGTIDDAGDEGPALTFGLAAVVQEFGDIVGPVTAAWMVVSWPRLRGLSPLRVAPLPAAVVAPDSEREPESSLAPSPEPSSGGEASRSRPPQAPAAFARPAWRDALPRELGDDLIAVASELQYLRVWTPRGCALVLGSLQEVEDAEGGTGMRVHRSWWVHARHVRGVRRRGDGAVCQLSDGREVPVSRRRRPDVLARFGEGVRYDVATDAPAVPPPGCDQNVRRIPT